MTNIVATVPLLFATATAERVEADLGDLRWLR
jgi:hypothetical protein